MRFTLKKEDKKLPEPIIYKDSVVIESVTVEEPEVFNLWDYVRVVNVRGTPEFQATADEKVIIAHRGNPILGNKHPMLVQTMKERERVITEYKKDLQADVAVKGPMYQALKSIAQYVVETKGKVAFACYCLPCNCHAMELIPVVVGMAQELLESTNTNQANIKNKPKI